MGAWGFGVFENDDACDWLAKFVDDPTVECVKGALEAVLAEETPSTWDVSEGMAAAAVVAHLCGRMELDDDDALKLDDDTRKGVMALQAPALTVCQRVLTHSELARELEGPLLQDWEVHIRAVLNALQGKG